jgi:hypothetical protein
VPRQLSEIAIQYYGKAAEMVCWVPAFEGIIAADDMRAQDSNDDCLAEDAVM